MADDQQENGGTIRIGFDENFDEGAMTQALGTYLQEICGIDAFARNHLWLELSSFLVKSDGNVSQVSSEWQQERKSFLHEALGCATAIGAYDNEVPSYESLGVMQLQVPMPADIEPQYYNSRRDLMLIGLRHILVAWSLFRRRLLIASTHSGQVEEKRRLDDHIHVLYERTATDPINLFGKEIEEYITNDCSWESIDSALGLFGVADNPTFDDEDEPESEPEDETTDFVEMGISDDEPSASDEDMAAEYADYMEENEAMAAQVADESPFDDDDPTLVDDAAYYETIEINDYPDADDEQGYLGPDETSVDDLGEVATDDPTQD